MLNEILGKKKSRTLPSYVMRGNVKLTDDKSIADSFNNYYYSEIGKDISSKVKGTNMHFSQYLPEKTIIHSLFLEPTNESEIVSITRKLKSSFSSGIDGLTSNLV